MRGGPVKYKKLHHCSHVISSENYLFGFINWNNQTQTQKWDNFVPTANESSVDQSASLATEGARFMQSAPFSPSSEAVCCLPKN